MTRSTYCFALALALPACEIDASIIGETAEGSGTGDDADDAAETDGVTSTSGASASETTGPLDETDTAGAPSDCESPCAWGVLLDGIDTDEYQSGLALELDAQGRPIVVSSEDGQFLAHRFAGNGEMSGPPAILADVPIGVLALWHFAIGPDGTAATMWSLDDGGLSLQRRSADVRTEQWTASDGDTSIDPRALVVAADGSLRIAYARSDSAASELVVAAYDTTGTLAWSTSLDEGNAEQWPQIAVGPDDSLLVWTTSGWARRLRFWRRAANGDVETNDVTVVEDILALPARRDDGWIFAGQVENGEIGGVSMRFVDDELVQSPATLDWPDAELGWLQPRGLVLVGDRSVVLTRAGVEVGTMQLRVYDQGGALESVTDLAAAHPAGAVDGDVVDAAVAADGSLYVLGLDRDEHFDFHYWLRRFAI